VPLQSGNQIDISQVRVLIHCQADCGQAVRHVPASYKSRGLS
jgi:hypothetical protein